MENSARWVAACMARSSIWSRPAAVTSMRRENPAPRGSAKRPVAMV